MRQRFIFVEDLPAWRYLQVSQDFQWHRRFGYVYPARLAVKPWNRIWQIVFARPWVPGNHPKGTLLRRRTDVYLWYELPQRLFLVREKFFQIQELIQNKLFNLGSYSYL